MAPSFCIGTYSQILPSLSLYVTSSRTKSPRLFILIISKFFFPFSTHIFGNKEANATHILQDTEKLSAGQACRGCLLYTSWQHPLKSGPPLLPLNMANQRKCSTGTPTTNHPVIYSTHLYLEPSFGYPGGLSMPPAAC